MELPRAQYSQEFRKESVKFFRESGLTLVEAAKRLSLPKGTLKKRRRSKIAIAIAIASASGVGKTISRHRSF